MEKEIELPSNHNLPLGYYYELPLTNEINVYDALPEHRIDENLLKKYGGLMPLSWIAEQIKKIKQQRMAPTIKTEKKAKIFVDTKRDESEVVVRVGIRNLEEGDDICIIEAWNLFMFNNDENACIQETFNQIRREYNL